MWASILVTLWALAQREGAEIDDEFFLDHEALQATVTFPALLRAASSNFFAGEPLDLNEAIPKLRDFRALYAGFMGRAGYTDLFEESYHNQEAEVIRQSLQRKNTEWSASTWLDITEANVHQLGEKNQGHAAFTPPELSDMLGGAAAGFAELLASAQPEMTTRFVISLLDGLLARADTIALTGFVFRSTKWLNKRGFYRLSLRLTESIIIPPEFNPPGPGLLT